MKPRITGLMISLVCLTLCSGSQANAKGGKKSSPVAIGAKLTVVSPLGTPPPIKLLAMAPRPNSLEGKTIYIVDDGFVGGDVLLKEMVAWFNRNMPSVNAIYRRKAGGFPDEDPALWAEIKAKGDAVIMGVGH